MQRPSHSHAGLFLEIPDGGLLPGPHPVTRAFTPQGEPIESFTLWHNPAGNLAIVTAAPPQGRRFFVYVEPAAAYRLWTPETGLTPSPILTIDPTRAGLPPARALAETGRVTGPIHHTIHTGFRRAPLSIGGDLTGRPRPAAFYLTAWLVSDDPGRTWIAPFTLNGEGEIRVNGQRLAPRQQSERWGGTGDWAGIAPGPNRVEIFHSAPGSGPFATGRSGGLMYLTWRTPNAPPGELGGLQTGDGAPPEATRWDSRVIARREIVRSGSGTLLGAQLRTNAAAAMFRHAVPKVYWFGNETPMLAYRFEVVSPGSSPDTVYTWHLGDGITLQGPVVSWLYPAHREQRVRLTAASGGHVSEMTLPFFTYSTHRTRLEDEDDRREYRRALGDMARAHPPGHPAPARWDAAVWRNLMRTAEPGKGYPLLRELFDRHGAALEAGVSREEREILQDLFLDVAVRLDPADGLAWIRTFRDAAREPRRRDELLVLEAEVFIHYQDDAARAERILRPLARRDDPAGRLARIRLGDLALLGGDLNLATRAYAEVQNLARIERNRPEPRDSSGEAAPAREGARRPPTAEARMERLLRQMGRPTPGAGEDEAEEWKLRALLDTSASEAVRSLLAQQRLWEAREALRYWERTLPLSKIAGDYVLLEARYYRAAGDPHRALRMLKAFCTTVEASNYLPEAAPLLLRVMRDTGEAPGAIRAEAERLARVLEFHPVARELAAFDVTQTAERESPVRPEP